MKKRTQHIIALLLSATAAIAQNDNNTSLAKNNDTVKSQSSTDKNLHIYNATTDFSSLSSGEAPYYVDKAQQALAINAGNKKFRDKFARATKTFNGTSGNYNVTIRTLGETDGECSYRFFVNKDLIGTRKNTPVKKDYSPQEHLFSNVTIPAGATLSIESNSTSNGLIPEGDIFAFARGRWTTLTLSSTETAPLHISSKTPPRAKKKIDSVIEASGDGTVSIRGELKRWHKITLTLDGPAADENTTPNPFYDYRFDVIFTHPSSGLTYNIPGYFAADGNAANSSASKGSKWRAHLSPDETGKWNYTINFRKGDNAAVKASDSGKPLTPYHGATGSFTITETDKKLPDFRARGRLQYVNKHHLRFKGDETYFIKAGADSPENLFAYDDFDNTPNVHGHRKSWAPHQQDYVLGDPTWAEGKGSELIGAVNYLASKGLNVMSFLTYSYNGDDKNVFPHSTAGDYTRMDCSKLDQWEIVLAHAQKKGIYLHFKTQETENDQDLDGGALGDERKLYYRELIARYGHHLALNWNLGEENTNTDKQRKAFAQWFYDNDPYHHHLVIHTYPNKKEEVYPTLVRGASKYTGASLQSHKKAVFPDTLKWRNESASHPWVVANDEQGSAKEGITADSNNPQHNAERANVLWGNIMAGGAGIESYFGYKQPENDLNLTDFRSRDLWWDQCRHALKFLYDNNVPFWDMSNTDNLISNSGNTGNHCLSKEGEVYVVYLRNGGEHNINLTSTSGLFNTHWYNPRSGGSLISGKSIKGGTNSELGSPPNTTQSDWVVLIKKAKKEPNN